MPKPKQSKLTKQQVETFSGIMSGLRAALATLRMTRLHLAKVAAMRELRLAYEKFEKIDYDLNLLPEDLKRDYDYYVEIANEFLYSKLD